jgi:hypothetical protein
MVMRAEDCIALGGGVTPRRAKVPPTKWIAPRPRTFRVAETTRTAGVPAARRVAIRIARTKKSVALGVAPRPARARIAPHVAGVAAAGWIAMDVEWTYVRRAFEGTSRPTTVPAGAGAVASRLVRASLRVAMIIPAIEGIALVFTSRITIVPAIAGAVASCGFGAPLRVAMILRAGGRIALCNTS